MPEIGIIRTTESGVDVVFEWKIENFFNLPETDGAEYDSPDFSFGGERWWLSIYPNGSSESNSYGHVVLDLHRYDFDLIRQSFSLSLKTAKGEKYNEQHVTNDFDFDNNFNEFNRFIPRSELRNRSSELVPEGDLTIICMMKSSTSAGSAICVFLHQISGLNVLPGDSESDSVERPSDSNEPEYLYDHIYWECLDNFKRLSEELESQKKRSEGITASTSDKCCHCKGAFDAESLSTHQRKCMHRPIRCPDCLEIVVLQKWLDEHECQKERSEAEKSENICVEASTQTTAEKGNDLKKKSENTSMEACTQTDEGNAENSENIHMESSTQTGEENEELKGMSITELNKVDIFGVVGSIEAKASGSNQTGAAGTKKSALVNLPEEHDWVTDVSDFLKERRGVDVTFELETPSGITEFIAHQLILALRSPYFEDAFYGTERNNGHLRISLKGTDPKAFEQMIRYCYDYKPCLRTIEDACALFKVAFEFKILSLQKLCRTFIRDSKIEAGNVFSVLEVSEQMEDKSLGDMCNKILQDKTRDVMATYELCDVTPVMVHTLLNLSNLSLNSEYELIKWIFDWAKVKSEDEDSSSENAREYLERLLKDMNFLALTIEQFALLCKENPHFFSSDEMASICLNIACPGTREMPVWYDNNVKCRVYAGSKE